MRGSSCFSCLCFYVSSVVLAVCLSFLLMHAIFFYKPSYSITMLCALVCNIKLILGISASLTMTNLQTLFFQFIVALYLPLVHISHVWVVDMPFAMSNGLMFISHLLMQNFLSIMQFKCVEP